MQGKKVVPWKIKDVSGGTTIGPNLRLQTSTKVELKYCELNPTCLCGTAKLQINYQKAETKT